MTSIVRVLGPHRPPPPTVEYALLPTPCGVAAGILDRLVGPGFDLRAVQDELRAHYVGRALMETCGV